MADRLLARHAHHSVHALRQGGFGTDYRHHLLRAEFLAQELEEQLALRGTHVSGGVHEQQYVAVGEGQGSGQMQSPPLICARQAAQV